MRNFQGGSAMSESRERALEIALIAVLMSAREQGIHIAALCDGAAHLIAELPDTENHREVAYKTVKGLSVHMVAPR
jgi:hypothetical protein